MGHNLVKTGHCYWLTILILTSNFTIAEEVTTEELPRVFQSLPAGWSLLSSKSLSSSEVDQLSAKWNVSILSIENTVIEFRGKPIQINTVTCPDRDNARLTLGKLKQGKPNPRMVARNDVQVFEFVARKKDDFSIALRARDALQIQPNEQTYRVQFTAVPIQDGDWMKLNQLCRLFKLVSAKQSSAKTPLSELTKSFEFGDSLSLRRFGQGTTESDWQIGEHDSIAGCRVYSVNGIVTSRRGGSTLAAPTDASENSVATEAWPIDDDAIESLAIRITANAPTLNAKVTAIREWMLSENGIRFGGPIVGSRYGTKKVLRQKYGHCWDLSDVFITLCRANEIPCRQVFGWLAGSEGHVWCEVLIDGRWHAVDPGSALTCGSDYVPFVISTTGGMPMAYASPVLIEAIE